MEELLEANRSCHAKWNVLVWLQELTWVIGSFNHNCLGLTEFKIVQLLIPNL